jgi:hypothetical protein
MPMTSSRDTGALSPMTPPKVRGMLTAQGPKVKLDFKLGQSRPEQPERGMKRHKGWPITGTSDAPLRESGILKLHI